jgi:protein TonB
MTHAASVPFRPQIDRSRIAAETGAIAINAVLLLALLVPIVPPEVFEPPRPEPAIVWLPRERPRPVVPPVVPVVRQPPRVSPALATVQPRPMRIEPPAVVIEGAGELFVPALDPGDVHADDSGDPIAPSLEPLAGAQLRYASAPPPAYPREALRDGATGTVLLEVLVDVDGRPLEVAVVRSSGRRDLDQAARRQVLRRWRFEPAMVDGRAVQAVGVVPVEFTLER